MLKELIELSKLKGVSAEEWEEFNSNFSKFDKDSSGSLEQKEFKALMYSVGEEMNKAEAAEVFAAYAGADGNIDRDGFLAVFIYFYFCVYFYGHMVISFFNFSNIHLVHGQTRWRQ